MFSCWLPNTGDAYNAVKQNIGGVKELKRLLSPLHDYLEVPSTKITPTGDGHSAFWLKRVIEDVGPFERGTTPAGGFSKHRTAKQTVTQRSCNPGC